MKTQLRGTNLAFVCPGCQELTQGSGMHMLPVEGDNKWDWNGDLDAPTLSPSILSSSHFGVCHSFLRDGHFEFLGDCTHSLAGQRVVMPDLPTWFTKEGQ